MSEFKGLPALGGGVAQAFLGLDTPPGLSHLRLVALTGVEGLSTMYRYTLEVVADGKVIDEDAVTAALLGKPLGFSMALATGGKRHFHGIVSRILFDDEQSRLRVEVVPPLWLLSRSSDCRVYAKKTIRQITEAVFVAHRITDYRIDLTKEYPPFEVCVQYRETTLNFLLRLWEQEGIAFSFEAQAGKSVLVLTDANPSGALQQTHTVPRRKPAVGEVWPDSDAVYSMTHARQLVPAQYTLTARNWATPGADLTVHEPTSTLAGPAVGEMYDLGEYGTNPQGQRYVTLRMEEEEVARRVHTGSGNVRDFSPGFRFKVASEPKSPLKLPLPSAVSYLITSVEHHAAAPAAGEAASYRNTFTCLPDSVAFRPPRATPKPVVQGVHYATVVNAKGESSSKAGAEVEAEADGRVRIRFHWDRSPVAEGLVLVRVSQAWAGHGFGGWFLPRIGQEVVVAFEEGDPDRPVIIGMVYGDAKAMPFDLGKSKTVSGIRTHSSRDDDSTHGNELSFEDAAGKEEVRLHAEGSLEVYVKRDERKLVDHDQTVFVLGSQTERVDKDRKALVKGSSTERVDGDQAVDIGGGLAQQVGGSVSLSSGGEIHIKAGTKLILEADSQLSLVVGGNYVDIATGGVSVNGAKIKLNCKGGSAAKGSGEKPKQLTIPDPARPRRK